MLIVDTGVFVAAADDNDPDHQECVELVEGTDQPLVTSPLVVAETGYLIDRQLGQMPRLASTGRSLRETSASRR